MSQVSAITNETFNAPEPSNIQRNDDVFSGIFEKEKLKVLFPSMLSVNFQSFANSPLFTGSCPDNEVNKIDAYPALENNSHGRTTKTSSSIDGTSLKAQKPEHLANAAEVAKQAKADQARPAENIIKGAFFGELELSPDFYSTLITSKNNSLSLRSIDVDDLVAQIKNKMKFLLENGRTELSIELKPENLGTVLMNISSHRGVLSINIYADQAAKQALEENIAELERSLKLADLNIDDLNILSDDGRKHNKGTTG
ncbi:MAG: flagellar hook-length control protein FliK [bacterium]